MNETMMTDILPFDHEFSESGLDGLFKCRLEIQTMCKENSFASLVPPPQPCFPVHPLHGRNQSVWPDTAEFSVCVHTHDRQFPDVKHEACVTFFDSRCDLERYIEQKKDWVKGTDGDFQIVYHVHRWDWGPQYESSGSI